MKKAKRILKPERILKPKRVLTLDGEDLLRKKKKGHRVLKRPG